MTGKLNLVGEYEQSLCASSVKGKNGGKYLNKEATKKALKNNLHNLFNQRWKCAANDRMWTSFDDTRTFIANGKYGKQFLAFNYKDRKSTRLNSSHSAKSRMPSSA